MGGHMGDGTMVAEAFAPGEYIKDELEARGWSQADLAEIMGSSPRGVSEMVAGKTSITPEMAQALGAAFGTSAQVWMNLDASYRLWRLKPNDEVSRRARLFSKGPIKELVRRGWIQKTDRLDVLEQHVKDFYCLEDIDAAPVFEYAARRPTPTTTPAQLAWLFRSRSVAHGVSAAPFTESSVTSAKEKLRPLMASGEDTRRIGRVLAECGIRFVLVEGLKGAKIDGATFWMANDEPVIALSLRFDRIDWFWFTLLHELDHVEHGEGSMDVTLVGTDATRSDAKPEAEQRADSSATSTLLSPEALDDFIRRNRPLFSKVRIAGFAHLAGVHPGIVVGQLQRKDVISYAHSRDMLERVQAHVVGSTITDGWGHIPSGF